jgi:hypothetical protein
MENQEDESPKDEGILNCQGMRYNQGEGITRTRRRRKPQEMRGRCSRGRREPHEMIDQQNYRVLVLLTGNAARTC